MSLESVLIDRETLSAEEFLKLTERDKINIIKTNIVPAKLGQSGDFGKIEVIYNHKFYKVSHGK